MVGVFRFFNISHYVSIELLLHERITCNGMGWDLQEWDLMVFGMICAVCAGAWVSRRCRVL